MCTPMVGYGPDGYGFACVMCNNSDAHSGRHDWPHSWSFLAARYHQEKRCGEGDDSMFFISLFKPVPDYL